MSKYKKILTGAVMASVLAACPLSSWAAAQDAPEDIIHTQSNPWVTLSGPQADASRVGPYIDTASGRLPSPARQTISGHRDMAVSIWLPSGFQMSATLPILILSGKFGSSPASYQNIAEHLASHGIIVIVPDHNDDPGSQSGVSKTTTQARIDDIHDVIRAIPTIAQNAGFTTGGGIACMGFDAGITDCLMNGGIHSEINGLHPWGGQFSSIMAIGPSPNNVPEKVASISTPIMFVGSMSDMNMSNGLLARHPDDRAGIRTLVAIQNFSDPYVTINRPDQPETYYWRSIITLWLKGTIGGTPEILKGIESYGSMTGDFIRVAIR